jgi:hypothetical protein
VHPTATSPNSYSCAFRNEASRLLTTGAVVHAEGTKLELDLSKIDGVPLTLLAWSSISERHDALRSDWYSLEVPALR